MELTIEIPEHTITDLIEDPKLLENYVASAMKGFLESVNNPLNVVQHLTCQDGLTAFRAYEKAHCNIGER